MKVRTTRTQDLAALERELHKVVAQRDELIEMIKEVEWVIYDTEELSAETRWCRWCQNEGQHKPDCRHQALVRLKGDA